MSTVGETFTEPHKLSPEEARLPERAKANIPGDQFATEIAALIGEAITDK
mgnify:CR=1 FL=1